MQSRSQMKFMIATAAIAATLMCDASAFAQGDVAPTNDAPNHYKTVEGWAKLPEGRKWGSTSAVEIDKDGKSIWVAERCGANSCLDREHPGEILKVDPILKFDSTGKLVKSFGGGMMVAPHGIYVDKKGNIWVTDYQDNAPAPARGGGRGAAGGGAAGGGRGAAGGGAGAAAAGGGAGRGAAPAGPAGPRPGSTIGHQVIEFSPEGKVLMTLGKKGGAADPDFFFAPNDVIVAPNGDIFVSCGHGQGPNKVYKFSPDGKLIKSWGKLGTGPGEFDQPHSLAFDSKGLLYIADRNNNRIQVFDQDGNFKVEYRQWSRPSGIYIDKHDNMYSADSESESVSRNHDGWKRGIRVGSLKDGKITTFIPDPVAKATGTSAAEGVAIDSKGNIYGAEVGPMALKRYEPIKK
jgi:sugar lactone lactonase YvrE